MSHDQVWKRVRDEVNPLIEELRATDSDDKWFCYFALQLKCRRADSEIEKLPVTAFSICARGDLQRYLASYDPTSKTSFAKATEYYMQALTLFPDDGRPHHQLSVLYLASRKPLQAAAHLLRSTKLGFITRSEANSWFSKLSARPGNLNDVPRNARKAIAKLCAAVAGEPTDAQTFVIEEFEDTEWLDWVAAILVNVAEESWSSDWLVVVAKWCLRSNSAALKLLSEHTDLPVELHLPSAIALRKVQNDAVSTIAIPTLSKNKLVSDNPCLIVIDGLNVAKALDKTFSPDSLKAACDYFGSRGHKVTVILPRSKKWEHMKDVLSHHVMFTPAKDSDDSYAIEYARRRDGCVVSNDLYRDWIADQNDRFDAELWRRTHVISFAISDDFDFLPDPRFVFPTSTKP